MREADIHDYARQLLDAQGEKAVGEEEAKTEEASTWLRIEAALKMMRGPHAS